MFSFNFNVEGESNGEQKSQTENEKTDDKAGNKFVVCEEIFPSEQLLAEAEFEHEIDANIMKFNENFEVQHILIESVIDRLTNEAEDINLAEQNRSDVVPGVYEGGAKVWECTEDLGLFITNSNSEGKCLIDDFDGKSVLDLGCGAGILGILALEKAALVHFQDYNKAVLQHITIPNVILNSDCAETIFKKAKFFSGDWDNYVTKSEPQKFDFILTSETIYNPKNYHKILNVLKSKLHPNGVCYLAAKASYFGVGGSLRQFEAAITKDESLAFENVFVCNENVRREILKIEIKPKS